MSRPPVATGRRGEPFPRPSEGLTPQALDFARLLCRCEQREEEIAGYLAELRDAVGASLGRLGYLEVDVHLAERSRNGPEMAGDLSVVMRLPLPELKRADFSLNLPLVVTSGNELRIRNAEINGFLVKETFVHSLEAAPTQVAEVMTHGLSRLYMAHLLRAGGRFALASSQATRPGGVLEGCL